MATNRDLQTVPLSLDQPCSDSDLFEISQLIHDWREIAPALELTQADEQIIFGYAPNSVTTSSENNDAEDLGTETRTSGYVQ